MKKRFKTIISLVASLMTATCVLASNVTLYSLDDRTISVKESEVEMYTKEGMGWFKEKPVKMYAADGRTLVVPADKVEDYIKVGWFRNSDLTNDPVEAPDTEPDKKEDTETKNEAAVTKAVVQYIDGTKITVPVSDVKSYIELGWEDVTDKVNTVTMYNEKGESKEVKLSEVERYEAAGWTKKAPENVNDNKPVTPSGKQTVVYFHDGQKKNIPEESLENEKKNGWYPAFDEACYAYAAFGLGEEKGAVALLEGKQYEAAFRKVEEALNSIEHLDSDYVSMLYYLRSQITDEWRKAANSPLGFINYWFQDGNGGTKLIVFEYRNISNSRISGFSINFDICDEKGNVIESRSEGYHVEFNDKNIKLPFDKTRVGWPVKNGDKARSVKNVKVMKVDFTDGTSWNR